MSQYIFNVAFVWSKQCAIGTRGEEDVYLLNPTKCSRSLSMCQQQRNKNDADDVDDDAITSSIQEQKKCFHVCNDSSMHNEMTISNDHLKKSL